MKISCIIPVYNEEKRIGRVLDVVMRLGSEYIHEVMVVDDGSTDRTLEVLSKFDGIVLIRQKENLGKTAAVYEGIKKASGDAIFLLDADLEGLTTDNILDLIAPVLRGEASVSMSLRRNSGWQTLGLDYITGERVFHKEMLEGKMQRLLELPGFGLEVFLNSIIIEKRLSIKVVPWPNVDSPLKFKKFGFWQGLKKELKMRKEIFNTFSFGTNVSQIIRMLRLRVK